MYKLRPTETFFGKCLIYLRPIALLIRFEPYVVLDAKFKYYLYRSICHQYLNHVPDWHYILKYHVFSSFSGVCFSYPWENHR